MVAVRVAASTPALPASTCGFQQGTFFLEAKGFLPDLGTLGFCPCTYSLVVLLSLLLANLTLVCSRILTRPNLVKIDPGAASSLHPELSFFLCMWLVSSHLLMLFSSEWSPLTT